jgi:hypothetical protein
MFATVPNFLKGQPRLPVQTFKWLRPHTGLKVASNPNASLCHHSHRLERRSTQSALPPIEIRLREPRLAIILRHPLHLHLMISRQQTVGMQISALLQRS